MSVGQIAQKKPDPCSFVIFGVTGDLAHRLVVPALYNLAASDLLPDKFCLVGVARKGVTSDKLRDSLMKGLREFATRPVDDAIAQRLLACVTCIEADPKDPASFDAMSKQLDRTRSRARHRRQSPVLPRDAAERIPADQPRTRPHRHAGRERRVAAAGGGKAVRHRSRFGKGAEQRIAQARRRARDLPDRSLSRQGDGAEHPGAAFRQRHVRADLEPQPYRPRADHGRRTTRRRPSRQLLRPDRRAARHGAEPSVSTAVAGRDGAADPLRRAFGACGKGRRARRDPGPERGRSAAQFGARPVSRPAGSATTRSKTTARSKTSPPAAPPKPMRR